MIASSTGGKFSGSPQNRKAMMLHGIGLALILLGGFGMAAKARFISSAAGELAEQTMSQGFPLWFWVKFVVWLILGGLAAAIKRIPEKATLWTGLIIVLGLVAVFLGVSQPF